MKRQWVWVTMAGALLAAWLSYPTIAHPGSMARLDTNDGRFSIWNVAWVAHALLTEPGHLFDANIFHPHRGTLAYSEANLVAGVMAMPVYALTGNPVAAHNSVVYAALVLAFVSTWALVGRLTGDGAVGLVSAAAFSFAPFVAARTPHIQLLLVFVFPVVMLAFHRFLDAPGASKGAVLGGTLGLAALACGYYGIFAGLAVAWASLWFAVGRWRSPRYGGGLIVAAAVAGAIVLPVLPPYLELRSEAGARRDVNVEELRAYSADVASYLTSPAHAHQWLRTLAPKANEVLFPGIVVILAAFPALVHLRRRRSGDERARASDVGRQPPELRVPATRSVVAFYVSLAVLAIWASFGPDAGLYLWLAEVLPFMSFLRAPARFGIVVVFALSVLAGFGLAAALPARFKKLAVAVLVVVTAAEISAAPWPLRQVPPVPEAYRMLAVLPRGPVVKFHFPYQPTDLHRHARYMFWSMWHWQPMVNGYSDYIPPDFRDIMVPINGFPDDASFRILRERGVRYVTIDTESYGPGAMDVLIARFPPYRQYLRPVIETGTVWLYEIVGYPPG